MFKYPKKIYFEPFIKLEKITKDISEAIKNIYHQLNTIILQRRDVR